MATLSKTILVYENGKLEAQTISHLKESPQSAQANGVMIDPIDLLPESRLTPAITRTKLAKFKKRSVDPSIVAIMQQISEARESANQDKDT